MFTILKAFFQLRNDTGAKELYKGDVFVPNAKGSDNEKDWGTSLCKVKKSAKAAPSTALTIEGELNKLAANIAIGRNMAGVHFYTDYYDSLRLGERIAVGILQEQMSNYPDAVSMIFGDFDDNVIEIQSSADVAVMVTVNDAPATDAWWNCSPATPKPMDIPFT